jgi:transcriptional regulator with XRE-family HTH domain
MLRAILLAVPPTSTPPGSIGGRLKEIREDRGLSRERVYDLSKERWGDAVSPSKLEKWENERNKPDAIWAARLAELYEAPLPYVFMLSDESNGKDDQ